MQKQKIELLAPAGDLDIAKAALRAGADACYIGGKWSARAYARNFGESEVKEILDYAHERGKKVYVALNTMLYEREMQEALSYTRFLYEAGVDAVIAADLGYIQQVRRCFPELSVHVSTQAGIQCGLGAKLMQEFNALHIPDMPPVTELFSLNGSYVNLSYPLPNGQTVKLLKDENVYFGTQLPKANSDRCYGLIADAAYLLISEYGENGADPIIVLFKKR